MRRVAFNSVLLVMAAVASSASVATTGVRVQINSRITSAANLPVTEKRLSMERNAARPLIQLPSFNPDPTPFLTEFYGPAKKAPTVTAPKAEIPVTVPEASVRPASDASTAR